MSREDPIKADKDYSSILDEQFPIIGLIANYKEAVDKYLVLEKQTRQASDLASSQRVIERIIKTLVDNEDWDYLNDLIVVLSKKHGQLKTAIQGMIKFVVDNLSELDDNNKKQLELKVKLIETIRAITDKKIFVEVERATVSRLLADIYLTRFKDLDKAVEILCGLQVETYSLMPFSDKVAYILEQIRLTLKKGDFDQAKILSRKIMLKLLKNFDKADEFKEIYLKDMIKIFVHEHEYLEIVTNLMILIEIPQVKNNTQELKDLLIDTIYYITLAPHDAHQHDLVLRLKANSTFKKESPKPIFELLEIFTTNELIHWSEIELVYNQDYFAKSAIFKEEANYKNLQKRIVEHNLRIINKYYQCIKLERLAKLLQLSVDEAEKSVSELVNSGMISAKINRPQGIVEFEISKDGALKAQQSGGHVNEVLSNWCYDMDKLLHEVDSIGHLINKEEMMHGIKQKV